MPPLRVLIADDHHLIRRGIGTLLEERPEWEICGEARTGAEAVDKAKELKPEIVILDMSMPDIGGLEVTRRILSASDRVEILVLTMHSSDHLIRECIKAGVRGFVVKSDSARVLVIAVETIARHQPFFASTAAEVILDKFNSDPSSPRVPGAVSENITSREREIIRLIAMGNTSKQIGTHLGISAHTAETHRSNLMRKLGVHSISELVRYAVRSQIIDA
jgi:DNA-binding NarL/FixJ family response regulator